MEPRGEWVRLLVETPDRGQASESRPFRVLPPELKPTEVRTAEPELEDVFIALLRQREQKEGETASGATAVETYAEIPEEQKERTAIEATELTRVFGDFTAVDHVTFKVKQGEIFGLLGANGAGKSTCIKMLTGILPPTSGEGHVSGADMRFAGQAIKERIGYVSQAFSLYVDLSVLENILLYAGIYGVPKDIRPERAEWVMEVAGLSGRGDAKVAGLPMGVRQRLALGLRIWSISQPLCFWMSRLPASTLSAAGSSGRYSTISRGCTMSRFSSLRII